jgi:MFS family permease
MDRDFDVESGWITELGKSRSDSQRHPRRPNRPAPRAHSYRALVVSLHPHHRFGSRLLFPVRHAAFLRCGRGGRISNTSIVVGRWFPAPERGRAFGFILAAAQMGGAISPLLVVPIQIRYGWRASFYVFGVLGVAWSAIWYWWFRDSPAEKRGVPQSELNESPQHSRHIVACPGPVRSVPEISGP